MTAIIIAVDFPPPYKQASADASERKNQADRVAALREKAKTAVDTLSGFPLQGPLEITICYTRKAGQGSDAANIIGGIADALQGIAYPNDRELRVINYRESSGPDHRYQVEIRPIADVP